MSKATPRRLMIAALIGMLGISAEIGRAHV